MFVSFRKLSFRSFSTILIISVVVSVIVFIAPLIFYKGQGLSIILASLALITVSIAVFAAWRISLTVRQLKEYLVALDNGDRSCPVDFDRKSEIGEVANIVDRLVNKQKTAFDRWLSREACYRDFSEETSASYWEEDFSAVKSHLDRLRENGIDDWRAFFDSHPEVVRKLAGLVKPIDVNVIALKILNCENKQELLDNFLQFFTTDSYNTFKEEIIALAEGKLTFEADTTKLTSTGEVVYVHLRLNVMLGYEDSWSNVLLCMEDITRWKKVEEALNLNKTWLEEAQRIAHLGSWDWDLEKNLLSWSDEMFRILGLEPQSLLPDFNIYLSYVHPDDRDMLQKAIETALQSRFLYEIEYRIFDTAKNLKVILQQGEVVLNAIGKPVRMISSSLDITDRKRVEMEAIIRTREMETISQFSKAMRTAQTRSEIYIVLLQQLSELFNAQGAALALVHQNTNETIIELGYRDWETWTGMRIFPSDGISPLAILPGRAYRNNNVQDDPFISDPGIFRSLSAVVSIPLFANKQPIGSLWFGRNTGITDQEMRLLDAIADMAATAIKRQSLFEDSQVQLRALQTAQALLVQSEKLVAIGELVAGVAHELNNPLTSIVLYSQMLQQYDMREEVSQDLNKIVNEALRAAKIVRGLRDFARQRPAERKPIHIDDVIRNTLELSAYELNTNHIRWDFQLSSNLPVVMADPNQLQQVFVNLINNARQAIRAEKPSGSLVVFAMMGQSDFLGEWSSSSNVIRIIFRDDGPGIPQDLLNRIFDPFFTTKPEGKGTGLGLSICHGIISEHGGHIWAENNPQGGATFIVELPVIAPVEGDRPAAEEVVQKSEPNYEQARVLVVDDEKSVLEIVSRALKRNGYDVHVASNGYNALAMICEKDFDLVLCDIRMPELSGPDLYRQVKEKKPDMTRRIIFTTGDVMSPDTRQFFEETGASYLPKPFELGQLIERIRSALKGIGD